MGGRLQSEHRFLKLDRAADQFAEKPLIDFGTARIFGEVALIMALAKNPDCCRVQAFDRVRERLKDRKAVFRPVAFQPERREGETMRRAVRQIEAALGGKAFIPGIGQALPSAADHAVEFGARWRLALELADLYEIFEFHFAHASSRFPIQRRKA